MAALFIVITHATSFLLFNLDFLSLFSSFPAPILPTVSQWEDMLSTAFSLAIVGYVINLAMGRTLAAKHGYDVDPNQVEKLYLFYKLEMCILFHFGNTAWMVLYRKCWLLAAAISSAPSLKSM